MSGKYLLDTNAAIRVLNQEVDLETRRGSGLETFLSLTVVGELLFGAEKSRRPEVNRARIDRLIERCPVVPQDVDTARRYGVIKAMLQSRGRPIPENDLWIAASALRILTFIEWFKQRNGRKSGDGRRSRGTSLWKT